MSITTTTPGTLVVVEEAATRYAVADGHSLAYQVTGGGGGIDVVLVPTLISHVEHLWEHPEVAHWLRRLAGLGRLIIYDRRGIGMSDPGPDRYTLADEAEDLERVLDAAGAGSVALVAQLDGGAPSCLFAATRPDRVRALVLHECFARVTYADDYPWAAKVEERIADAALQRSQWGDGAVARRAAPSWSGDPRSDAWLERLERLSGGPHGMSRFHSYLGEADVRAVLPSIRAPTLVTRRRDSRLIDRRHALYLVEHIPAARLLEQPGEDSAAFAGDTDGWLDDVGRFITGEPPPSLPERITATLLFTDIVGSTDMLSRIGDAAWRRLLEHHDALARRQLAAHGGRKIKTLGDGFFATFDNPADGLRCALGMLAGAPAIGVTLRAGVHSGECEAIDDDLAGLTVHEAARIAAAAAGGEVLASNDVRARCGGSGLEFEDRGERTLKGLPDSYRLWSVSPEA